MLNDNMYAYTYLIEIEMLLCMNKAITWLVIG